MLSRQWGSLYFGINHLWQLRQIMWLKIGDQRVKIVNKVQGVNKMKNEKSNIESKISYLLLGGGIGAILALLFAPKAGEELRSDIADATRKGMDKTGEIASQLSETAQTAYSDTKTKANEIFDSARQKIDSVANVIAETPAQAQNALHDKVEQVSTAIKAGRKEYDREDILQGKRVKGKAN